VKNLVLIWIVLTVLILLAMSFSTGNSGYAVVMFVLGFMFSMAVLAVILALGRFADKISSKPASVLQEFSHDALNIATKIVYVKTVDMILFTAYELILETKNIRSTTFTYDNIPISTIEELNVWLEFDVLEFLPTQQWVDVKMVPETEAESTLSYVKAFFMQGFNDVFVESTASTCWCLQMINNDNEGMFLVAVNKKPKNHVQLETALSKLFDSI